MLANVKRQGAISHNSAVSYICLPLHCSHTPLYGNRRKVVMFYLIIFPSTSLGEHVFHHPSGYPILALTLTLRPLHMWNLYCSNKLHLHHQMKSAFMVDLDTKTDALADTVSETKYESDQTTTRVFITLSKNAMVEIYKRRKARP